jgi:eukaryotic-like serine/threonine-protein kinase
MRRFGPFEVDFATSELRRNGARVRIQEQPLRVLEALLERPREPVTREYLKERLWPADTFVDFERSLNAAVAKLRQTLRDSADAPVYVETLARVGYRFIAPVMLPITESQPPVATSGPIHLTRRWIAVIAGVTVAACVLGVLALTTQRPLPDPRDIGVTRFILDFPANMVLAGSGYWPNVAISPDGRIVAMVVEGAGQPASIWIRPLAAESAYQLTGSEGASLPFWSPDSKNIGFFAGGRLERMSLSGGSARTLCDSLTLGSGATWGRSGTILYSSAKTLHTVDAEGGPCKTLTRLTPGELRQGWPQFLPEGRRFLYFSAFADPAKNATYLGSLDGEDRDVVLVNKTRASFAPASTLLFVRDGTLLAQEWNPVRNRTEKRPAHIARGVNAFSVGPSAFSVSANGVLVYRAGAGLLSQLACYTRDGKRLKTIGIPAGIRQFTLSPDEKTLALTVASPGSRNDANLWLLRIDTGVAARYHFGIAENSSDPIWSPDSRRIVLSSFDVDGQNSDLLEWVVGEQRPKTLLSDGKSNKPDDWSSDGRFVIYRRDNRLGLALAMNDGAKPMATGDTEFGKDQLHLSPDGTLVAYNTLRPSGRHEIFVAAFPSFSGAIQVSGEGGVQPIWSRDGKELFYLRPDGTLMSVDIRSGASIEPSAPRVLFRTPAVAAFWGGQYAISPDKQRVYVIEPLPSAPDALHVITRWDGIPEQH